MKWFLVLKMLWKKYNLEVDTMTECDLNKIISILFTLEVLK